jgi:predicted XRE-type DNA-binding protein
VLAARLPAAALRSRLPEARIEGMLFLGGTTCLLLAVALALPRALELTLLVSGVPMTKKTYEISSGNVFADLDVSRPAEAFAKAELAHKIVSMVEARGLTQAAAAKLLQVEARKRSSGAARIMVA